MPPVQVRPLLHAVLQLPQSALLVLVSTHWPAQEVRPVPHAHLLPMQTCPLAQAVPQTPQFCVSVAVFAQL